MWCCFDFIVVECCFVVFNVCIGVVIVEYYLKFLFSGLLGSVILVGVGSLFGSGVS